MHQFTVNLAGSRDDFDPKAMRTKVRAADDSGVNSVWAGESWGPGAITQPALAAAWMARVQINSTIVNTLSDE